MNSIFRRKTLVITVALFFLAAPALVANAVHSWGDYHWARTGNPFTLKLGDNVSGTWDEYLATTSTKWTLSDALNTMIVPGNGGRSCKATTGRVEVCAAQYGNNGWLGLAQISINKSRHITKGVAKLNDTYFNTAPYNTTAWKNMVMCQEVGHIFGLDHQDENDTNVNLGSCMDYTNNPSGPPSNEYPDTHDYVQLAGIYSHTDGTTTVGATTVSKGNGADVNTDNPSGWGKEIRNDAQGRGSLFEKDLGNGEKVFTFVVWTK